MPGIAFRRRSGFSNITSTVILSSVILALILVAIHLSNDVLNIQIAASEFKTAENLMTTINNEIKTLLFKPGSSKVIMTSFSTIAPGYINTGKKMNITLQGSVDSREYSLDINRFNIDGRQIITGAPDYDLKGDSSLIVFPYNGSISRIHVSKPRNMRVSLDYERVLCTFTGVVNMFNGSYFVPYNTLELTGVVLSFGEFEVSSNAMLIIRNEKVVPDTLILTGNISVTVSTQGGSDTIYLTDLGGNPSYDTQVNFHTVYIELSVEGGG